MSRTSLTGCWAWLIAGAVVACSSAATPDAKQQTAGPDLQRVMKKREQLQKQLAGESAKMEQRCVISDGDCRLLAADKRARVVREGEFPECYDIGDADLVRGCEDKQAIAAGKSDELREYYEWENWCTGRILACVQRVHDEGVETAKNALADERRGEVATLPDADDLDLAVEVASEKVKYLRGTFPMAEEGLCRSLDASERCRQQLRETQQHLERVLRLPDESYDLQQARSVYRKFRNQEASCYEPEYECLRKALNEYGAAHDGGRFIDANLDVVEKRQALLRKVSLDAGEACVASGAQKYQDLVMSRFERYAGDPSAVSRAQLDQTFLMVHRTQVSCLQRAR